MAAVPPQQSPFGAQQPPQQSPFVSTQPAPQQVPQQSPFVSTQPAPQFQSSPFQQAPPKDTNLERFSKLFAAAFAMELLKPFIAFLNANNVPITIEKAMEVCNLPSMSSLPLGGGGGGGGVANAPVDPSKMRNPGPGECIHCFKKGGSQHPAGSYCLAQVQTGSSYCSNHDPSKKGGKKNKTPAAVQGNNFGNFPPQQQSPFSSAFGQSQQQQMPSNKADITIDPNYIFVYACTAIFDKVNNVVIGTADGLGSDKSPINFRPKISQAQIPIFNALKMKYQPEMVDPSMQWSPLQPPSQQPQFAPQAPPQSPFGAQPPQSPFGAQPPQSPFGAQPPAPQAPPQSPFGAQAPAPQAPPQSPFGAQPPQSPFGAQPSAPQAPPQSPFGAQPPAPQAPPQSPFGAQPPAPQAPPAFQAPPQQPPSFQQIPQPTPQVPPAFQAPPEAIPQQPPSFQQVPQPAPQTPPAFQAMPPQQPPVGAPETQTQSGVAPPGVESLPVAAPLQEIR